MSRVNRSCGLHGRTVRGCYLNINDDAVCLKGGKGTFADKDSTNGPCRNILIEACRYDAAGAGVTFGSEAWDCSNVILRDCTFNKTTNIVLFKMRPDTPQSYCNVLVKNVSGVLENGIRVAPWLQFFNKQERPDMPRSRVSNVTLHNVNVICSKRFYDVRSSDNYDLEDFTFDNVEAQTSDDFFLTDFVLNLSRTHVYTCNEKDLLCIRHRVGKHVVCLGTGCDPSVHTR